MRVLIVRTRALGDEIQALPVACALKDALPDAFVGWLVEASASEVLDDHPAVDERIVVPRGWTRSPRQLLRVRRTLADRRYDVVLDLHGVRASVLGALLSGAPRRLGFLGMVSHEWRNVIRDEGRQRALSRTIARVLRFEIVRATREHIVERYLEILAPLGVREPKVRFGLVEAGEDAHAVDAWLSDAGLAGRPYALLHPGGAPHKMWPAERFAALARHLSAERGLRTLVVSGVGEWEREAAARVVDESEGHAAHAPVVPWKRLAALMRRARLVVAGESGPLHLAAAVGAPCVGLIGHAHARRFRPYGNGNLHVAGNPVPTHLARHGGVGIASMRAIDVDAVREACDRITSGTWIDPRSGGRG